MAYKSYREVPPDVLGAVPIGIGERPVVVLEALVAVHAGHVGAEVTAAPAAAAGGVGAPAVARAAVAAA